MNYPHCCGISVVLLVLSVTYTSQASTCPERVRDFYEALGCKQLTSDPISGCVTQYDCSMIIKSSENQCFRRGKVYGDGAYMPDNSKYCDISCRCRFGQVTCAVADCPLMWDSIPLGCLPVYGEKCCDREVVCKADAKYTCTFGNETYLPTQHIDVDECTVCKCEEGFKGEIDKRYCWRRGCTYYSGRSYYEMLAKKCAPFYVVDRCCPVTTACADGTEVINKKEPKPEGGLTCIFGNHTVSTSDEVKVMHPFLAVCKCIVPPLLTCNSQLDYKTVDFEIDL